MKIRNCNRASECSEDDLPELNLQVRDADVAYIANSAARHAAIMKNQVAGMSANSAKSAAINAKGTDAMMSIVRRMLSRGATKAQALLAATLLASED